MSRRKGSTAERELSNTLEDEFGWFAQRAGASGSATERPRPDVIAVREADGRPRVMAIEVKAWKDATGQLDAHEIADLRDIAERTGARAMVIVRPSFANTSDFEHWHCFGIGSLHKTPGGNYSIRKSDLPGLTLQEAFG